MIFTSFDNFFMEFFNIGSPCVRDGWEGCGGRMGGRGTGVGVGGGKV